VPEGVVWTAIAAHYRTRFINQVVRTYFQDAGNQVTRTRNPARDAAGSLYWKTMVLNKELRWFWQNPVYFVIEAARWTRFGCMWVSLRCSRSVFGLGQRAAGC
jgi:hypothetical protein